MAIPTHTPFTNNNNQYEESLSQWQYLCSSCFKSTSSSRPPIFNAENCSCFEISGVSPPSLSPLGCCVLGLGVGYDHTTSPSLYHGDIQSYPSSTFSFQGQEGPEKEGVRLCHEGGRMCGYLPLSPEKEVNEIQRPRYKSEFEMSFQMRRFLVEDGYSRTYHSSPLSSSSCSHSDNHLAHGFGSEYGSRERGKGGKKAKKPKNGKGKRVEYDNGDSVIQPGEEEFRSCLDEGSREEMRDVGAWMDDFGTNAVDGGVEMQRDGGYGFAYGYGYGYPMNLSGFTEFVGEGN